MEQGDPYLMFLKKNWKGFLKYFENKSFQDLLQYRAFEGCTAFHIAAVSGTHKLLKRLIEKVPKESRKSLFQALMEIDDHGNTALHEVATTDCVEAAKELVKIIRECSEKEEEKTLLFKNKLGETPHYRAAALGQTKMLKYFDREVGSLPGHFRRDDSISILHIAVIGQHFDTAIWLLGKDMQLAHEKTEGTKMGMTAFQLIALMPNAFESSNPMSIWKRFFCFCVSIFLDDEDDDGDDNDSCHKEDLETGKNHPKRQTVRSKMHRAIWRHVIELEGCSKMKKIWKEKQKHYNAVELVKVLVKEEIKENQKVKAKNIEIQTDEPKLVKKLIKKDKSREEEKIENQTNEPTIVIGLGKGSMNKEKKLVDVSLEELVKLLMQEKYNSKMEAPHHQPETKDLLADMPLVFAASNGITEIFNEIINKYPLAIHYVNDKGENVLHVAIKHRQDKIIKCIQNYKMSISKLASRIDKDGNTILHHVADMDLYRGGTRPGPALQYQEELKWFHMIEDMMPDHYTMHRNKTRKITANDLFEETHADQLKKAQKWIKETSQSCSTLSILVATVVFAAAFTVPGGNNEKGFPIFLHSTLFSVFSIMDVVSLAFSLSSVVMFLSILTSSFERDDFFLSLPRKLTAGFTFLFFSVITSMITFSTSLLLIIRLDEKWTAALYAAAFFPVIVLAVVQFPFYTSFAVTLFAVNLKDYYDKFKEIFS